MRNGWGAIIILRHKKAFRLITRVDRVGRMQRATGSGDFPADLGLRAMIRDGETIERKRAGWDGMDRWMG